MPVLRVARSRRFAGIRRCRRWIIAVFVSADGHHRPENERARRACAVFLVTVTAPFVPGRSRFLLASVSFPVALEPRSAATRSPALWRMSA